MMHKDFRHFQSGVRFRTLSSILVMILIVAILTLAELYFLDDVYLFLEKKNLVRLAEEVSGISEINNDVKKDLSDLSLLILDHKCDRESCHQLTADRCTEPFQRSDKRKDYHYCETCEDPYPICSYYFGLLRRQFFYLDFILIFHNHLPLIFILRKYITTWNLHNHSDHLSEQT